MGPTNVLNNSQKVSKRYYPTRLATTLTSGNAALAGAMIKHSSGAEEPRTDSTTDSEPVDQGFVILETNYKLYAYTGKTINMES